MGFKDGSIVGIVGLRRLHVPDMTSTWLCCNMVTKLQ